MQLLMYEASRLRPVGRRTGTGHYVGRHVTTWHLLGRDNYNI